MASGFVWYELMTSNLASAEAFYKAVVGWKTERMPGDMPYITGKVGDAHIAGLMEFPEEMGNEPQAFWMGYILAPDADAATKAVAAAGGVVCRAPDDIPNIGRFSVVQDPQGVTFALFQPLMEQPDAVPPMGVPGTVGWHELYAREGKSAFEFYSGQFGWEKDEAMDMGPMGVYQLFKVNGQQVGGIMTKPDDIPMPAWVFYFNVERLDAAVERVKVNGGMVLVDAMEVPGGQWIAQCMDPQGAWFAMVAPTR